MPGDTWNAQLYRRFERERTRPARDLLAAVASEAPGKIVDLGCGPGNSTELLVERFSAADVLGIDSSDAMLANARTRLPAHRFEPGDIATWQPASAPDLLFANASLHWVPQHAELIPRLFGLVAPGGALAFQVPDNRDEPSHRLMRETAAMGPWVDKLASAGERVRVLAPAAYYDLLAPIASSVEVWRTVYHHRMDDAAAIVEWVRSTGLQPFLAPLADAERAAFLKAYEASIAKAYPVRSDGKRLLLFPRLFVVAYQ